MDSMTIVATDRAYAGTDLLGVRSLAPTGLLRTTGGVRPRAFGATVPTTSPPGPQLTS